MTLTVKKLKNGLFEARVTPPHSKFNWVTSQPLSATGLVQKLLAQGCHQQDIGDAFYEIDPNWVGKSHE
jgi:hypothetical protein